MTLLLTVKQHVFSSRFLGTYAFEVPARLSWHLGFFFFVVDKTDVTIRKVGIVQYQ